MTTTTPKNTESPAARPGKLKSEANVIPFRAAQFTVEAKNRTRTAVLTDRWNEVTFTLPASILSDFKTYWKDSIGKPWNKSNSPDPDVFGWEYYFLHSLAASTRSRENHPFNRPSNGVPSEKTRLGNIRRLEKLEESETLSFEIGLDFWERVKDRAAYHGITPGEHIQLSLDYHAALWRKRNAPKAPKAFASFEKGLARDAKLAKARA